MRRSRMGKLSLIRWLSFAFGTRSGWCHSLDPPPSGERVGIASREGGIIPACGIIPRRVAARVDIRRE